MIIDQRTERPAELPSCVRGALESRAPAAGEAQRHQLVSRIEVRLRDPADSFGRVIHGAGEFVWDSRGAAVGPPAVVEDHPAAGVHQALDHGVGVLRRVIGLRGVRSASDALTDLAQTGNEL